MTPIGKAIEALELADLISYSEINSATFAAAIAALRAQPTPPPECQTEGEKTAYAFGWWKGIESLRMAQPDHRELVKTLRLGASISRERSLNLDFAKIADEAADALEGKV